MTTDDFLRDQTERSLRDRTQRRRDGRSRKRQIFLLGGTSLIALLILGGPSLLSHSSIGRSMLTKALASYGFDGSAETMRIGWITPMQMTGLKVAGTTAGSEVSVDQIDMDMTVMDLIADSSMSNLGQITIRGVNVKCSVDEGRSSIEDDLAPLLNTSGGGGTTTGSIIIQDITVTVTDRVTNRMWQLTKSNADVILGAADIKASFDGVLTEPSGSGGSLGGSIDLGTVASQGKSLPWKFDLKTESLPLSVVALARRRLPELASSIPRQVGGDATGAMSVNSTPDGIIEASIRQFRIRNLTAEDEQMLGNAGTRMWKNSLATLDGDVTLTGTRLFGRRVEATTDFAKATMDGAVSTTFSLVGSDDNPLRWLEAIDGTATAEVDLAKLDQALPGMLPLRDGAELVSGRSFARVDSNPGVPNAGNPVRRSKLSVQSDAIRARANGRAVVIDPIELTATVATERGQVRAEEFTWKSTFGSAIGQGDLRSGNADIEVDFGRLTAMLRPIVEISEASLDGIARGQIRWSASNDDVWRLTGKGDANNLLVTLPGGQSIRRQQLKGEVEAIGHWGGQSLDELSLASFILTSNGLDLRAGLVRAIPRPDPNVPMPIAVDGNGRLETLAELLGPWMPADLVDATGDFTLAATADVSAVSQRLTTAKISLKQPRVTYGDRYFSQPNIQINFAGELLLPDGKLSAETLTLAGDAISAAAQGTASSDQIDMKIKWRAKLERLQGSVQTRIATSNRNTNVAPVQPVGYTSATTSENWLMRGDCEGEIDLKTRNQWLDITNDMTGKNIAVLQPPSAATQQTVGPMPGRAPQAVPGGPGGASTDVVWAEPNVKINGKVGYETTTGNIVADGLQVAGDWFATTLSGQIAWNDQIGEVRLKGPARLKMDEVASRLTPLAGIPIFATGVHETPLDVVAIRQPNGEIALDIQTNLGWETAETAGIEFGRASIPVRMTETTVSIAPTRVAVGGAGNEQGALNLAGRVNYRPGPMWMQLDKGIVADSIRLTPEMTERWLKYLAPLAANTAQIQGTISADLDEALIVFDDPNQSRIIGRFKIGGVEMNAGPLANQIIGGIDQLKSIAGALMGQTATASSNRTLVSMPPQTVDFSVDRGIVTHERMYFDIDRAQVITSGRVSFDGRMNMVAQVPLDSRWLGKDLQGLVGQSVSLPIDGTLSKPSLDSAGVRQVVAQLGTKAIQGNAENYIQKQLSKQMEKIGLEKLFGK